MVTSTSLLVALSEGGFATIRPSVGEGLDTSETTDAELSAVFGSLLVEPTCTTLVRPERSGTLQSGATVNFTAAIAPTPIDGNETCRWLPVPLDVPPEETSA